MIDQIFDFSIEVLEEWGMNGLHHTNRLLGLWHGERKLASMGIAIEKLTTFHGMALNLFENVSMISALQALNPCGLKPERYGSVQEFLSLPENAHETFNRLFLKRIQNEWK